MEAACLLATTATDGPSSASSSAKRKREAKDEARRKRRKKEKEAARGGPTDMSEDEDEGDATTTTAEEVRWRRAAAARLVLSAMRSCFQSDRSGFVDKARFEMIMPAVVSQLECGSSFPAEALSSAAGVEGAEVEVDEVASCRRHAEELVGPCLAQLAAASGKDALWKALASAVLMRTRSKRAGVRVAALVSLRQCFEVVGEEFLSLLPECLPFLSELLEVRKRVFAHILFWGEYVYAFFVFWRYFSRTASICCGPNFFEFAGGYFWGRRFDLLTVQVVLRLLLINCAHR